MDRLSAFPTCPPASYKVGLPPEECAASLAWQAFKAAHKGAVMKTLQAGGMGEKRHLPHRLQRAQRQDTSLESLETCRTLNS